MLLLVPTIARAFLGDPANLNYGSIGGGANSLDAAGTVYKMDAVTGEPVVFAVLPQQETTITHIDPELFANDGEGNAVTRQTGSGLGNIYHDKVNDQFFVSNFEDGRIYRLDSDGNIIDSYDPGSLDDGSAGAPSIDELVYGLTVSPDGSKLFYGLNKTVFSIDLNPDGSLPGTVNNNTNIVGSTWDNYTGANETEHSTIPDVDDNEFVENTDVFISDLEFLPDGNLLVGGRVYGENSIYTAYNHGGSVYTLDESNGTFSDLTEIKGYSTVTNATGDDDGYGGIAYDQNLDGSFDYVISSADIINEDGPHGLAVFPDDANNLNDSAEIFPRGALGYGGITFDAKGVGGDVDAFNPGVIRGNVSNETTGNGIENVTLSLLDSEGNTVQVTDPNTGNLVDLIATTDANGDYEFNNLLAGAYTIVQSQPLGLVSVSENEGGADNDEPTSNSVVNNEISATVVLGEFDVGNDFVEAAAPPILYKIGNRVWSDENGNGSIDGNEPGIADVQVKLLDSNGVAIAVTTTSNDGYYLFTEIPEGDYIVEIVPTNFNAGQVLENLVSTTVDETDPNNDIDSNDNGLGREPDLSNGIRSGTISLGPDGGEPINELDISNFVNNTPNNQANLTVDFGLFEPASLGDTVFLDNDGDGIQDAGEPGVAGVDVTLTGGGADGVIADNPDTTDVDEAADNTTETTTIGADGTYSFANLNPGEEYQVTFEENTLPQATEFTTANQGGDDTNDSDANANGVTPIVTLTPGENNLDVDAGVLPLASLGDKVFSDNDGDGIQDAGEVGIAGVDVTLTGGGADGVIGTGDDDTTATTTTDSDGNYEFTQLNPGEEYQVTFEENTLPQATEFTTANQGGDDTNDSDANANGVTPIVTLTPGENNLDVDAGVLPLASLGDSVFLDNDGDGIQDAGEAGIAGVDVTLTGGGADGVIGTGDDDTTATTTTDSDGNYEFTQLNPGRRISGQL